MRLFLALTLPEEVCDLASDLQDRIGAGRPVQVENLHLTLAFLGELPESALEPLHEGLRSVQAPVVELSLGGGVGFGNRRDRAVALGADGGTALRDLHDRIRSRLYGVGLELDRRRFRPHVTLLRIKGADEAARALAKLPPGPLGPYRCDSFGLFLSHLHRDGARHDELARYPLG